MNLKNVIFSATIASTLMSPIAEAIDNAWWRDADNHYRGIANSEDSGYQAIIQQAESKNGKAYVGFTLVIPHANHCAGKNENYRAGLTMAVNDRKVAFNMSCYQEEWLNIKPATLKSNLFVLKEFNRNRNKNVTFVIPKNDAPDWVFNFSTKGFGKIYSSINESTKEPLR